MIYMWLGRGCDIAHAWIPSIWLDLFQFGQDKMITMMTAETPFTVEIPVCKHWLSDWLTTLQSRGLIWYKDASTMADGSEASACDVKPRRWWLSFSINTYATVFLAEISVSSVSAKVCTERNYKIQQIHICSDNWAVLWDLEASIIMPKLVWECRQPICALSNRNKVILLCVPGHRRIQGNEDADTLAREVLSSSFLGPEPAISISPCVGRLKIEQWLIKKHSKCSAATPGTRQLPPL
jgi:hypothetical protein